MSLEVAVQNRRRWERFPCNLEAVVYGVVPGERGAWPGTVWNVSRDGLKLVVNHPIAVKSEIRVQVESPVTRDIRTLAALVVYSHTEMDGTCSLGCRLFGEMSEQDLQDLLQD